MTVLEIDNTNDVTTHHWSSSPTIADQINPVTRRVSLVTYAGEIETREIERNRDFHSVIIERLAEPRPDNLIDADEALED